MVSVVIMHQEAIVHFLYVIGFLVAQNWIASHLLGCAF